MDINWLTYLFFLLLLGLSALFSGAEVAFFSITSLLKEQLATLEGRRAKTVIHLISSPHRLLITILIGNTLVNVTLASLAALLIFNIASSVGLRPEIAVAINVVVVTFFILVLSEISPKILAINNPLKFAQQVSPFIAVCYYLFLPISWVLAQLIVGLSKLFHLKESDKDVMMQASEFQALLEIGEEKGELEQDEKEMIHQIFEFSDTTVREIMVPRTDMVCVDIDTSIEELIGIIKSRGHTRIPVYKESIDKIVGIIHAKDLLPFLNNSNLKPDLIKLARPAMFVPESKKIDDLLRNFQSEQQHMAIVVDEYGGTSGLVTLEDVIEEIVGEIRDEYDKVQTLYKKINDNTFVVDAKIDIESLNELIDIELPESDEYDTLGGYILENMGSLPSEKQKLQFRDFELEMEKVERNRIVSVKITRKSTTVKEQQN